MRRFLSTSTVLILGPAFVFAVLPYEAQLALIDAGLALFGWVVDNRYAVALVLFAFDVVFAGLIFRAGFVAAVNMVYDEGDKRNKADRERRLK